MHALLAFPGRPQGRDDLGAANRLALCHRKKIAAGPWDRHRPGPPYGPQNVGIVGNFLPHGVIPQLLVTQWAGGRGPDPPTTTPHSFQPLEFWSRTVCKHLWTGKLSHSVCWGEVTRRMSECRSSRRIRGTRSFHLRRISGRKSPHLMHTRRVVWKIWSRRSPPLWNVVFRTSMRVCRCDSSTGRLRFLRYTYPWRGDEGRSGTGGRQVQWQRFGSPSAALISCAPTRCDQR